MSIHIYVIYFFKLRTLLFFKFKIILKSQYAGVGIDRALVLYLKAEVTKINMKEKAD